MAPVIFVLAVLLPAALVQCAPPPPGCLTATLPNILDLGTCLGPSLLLCNATVEDILAAVLQIVECLIAALLNLDVETALAALLEIIDLVLSLLGLDIVKLNGLVKPLCAISNVSGCKTIFKTAQSCRTPIAISLPGTLNLDKCLGDTLLLCNNGGPCMDNVLVSLLNAVLCLLKTLLGPNPGNLLCGLACTVAGLLETVAASVSLVLKLLCLSLAASIRLLVTCG